MFKVVLFDFGFIRPDKDVYSRLCVCLQVYRTEHVVVVNSEVNLYFILSINTCPGVNCNIQVIASTSHKCKINIKKNSTLKKYSFDGSDKLMFKHSHSLCLLLSTYRLYCAVTCA